MADKAADALWAASIPMRGQEPLDLPLRDDHRGVIHPHEGSGVGLVTISAAGAASHPSP